MFTLGNAEFFITRFVMMFVYAISVTINGVAQTFVADKMGDDTAKNLGFDTWNPLVHVDPVGFVALLIFNLGWPRFIPFNPNNIYYSSKIRLLITYLVQPVIALLLALISLVVVTKVFDAKILSVLAQALVYNKINVSVVYHALQDYASLSILVALILVAFVILNIFIAALSLLLNILRYIVILATLHGHAIARYANTILIVGPVFLVFFLVDPLKIFLVRLIFMGAEIIRFIF